MPAAARHIQATTQPGDDDGAAHRVRRALTRHTTLFGVASDWPFANAAATPAP